jgi:rhomboid protease GluP
MSSDLGFPRRTPATARPGATDGSRFAALGILILASLGVFALEVVTAPLSGALDGTLVEHGGLYGAAVDGGDWWRVITAGFLHASTAHLLGNLIALVVLGGVLTLAVGPLRMVLIYLTGLVGASLSVLAFEPNALTVGASGAIFGLAGGALVVGLRRRHVLLLLFAVAWTVYTLSSTLFVPGISQAGHLGGLAAGGACGWLLVGERAQLRDAGAALVLVSLLLVALFCFAMVV